MYKILALDLDGTLTNSKKEITPHTLDILTQAQQKGLRIVLASGRPTQGIMPLANQLHLKDYKGYILAFNGGLIIDCTTGEVIYQKMLDTSVYKHLYETGNTKDFKILSYKDNCIACEDIETAKDLQKVLNVPSRFRVYANPDVIGVELGGSLKNVIAIASGFADAMGLGDNCRGALLTRGMAEIVRVSLALGAKPSTLYGLSVLLFIAFSICGR